MCVAASGDGVEHTDTVSTSDVGCSNVATTWSSRRGLTTTASSFGAGLGDKNISCVGRHEGDLGRQRVGKQDVCVAHVANCLLYDRNFET